VSKFKSRYSGANPASGYRPEKFPKTAKKCRWNDCKLKVFKSTGAGGPILTFASFSARAFANVGIKRTTRKTRASGGVQDLTFA
jgi:hypothetical protein